MTLSITSVPSVHFEDRPDGYVIDTIIIHSMHNPDASERFDLAECKNCLDSVELSVHYLIGLRGEIWALVPEEKKAWHAGESTMPTDGRTGVNAFSIGIELVGSADTDFQEEQYSALAALCGEIAERYPITAILGHSHIAPERKTDPWGFDWERFRREFESLSSAAKKISFPEEG